MTLIRVDLESGELLDDEVNAKRIKRLALNYKIIDRTPYKKGFSMPYFRCVP